MAKRCAIALCPRPASWGKMNHIQWLCLRPPPSSATTRLYTGDCASTNRLRSNGSVMVSCPGVVFEHDPDPKGRVSEKWKPVFPRDKRGTRLRRDHAQIER